MAFSGALLGILLTVYNLEIFNNRNFLSIIYMLYFIKLCNLFFVCKAIYCFSRSMKTNSFNQFPLNSFFIDHSYFKKNSNFLKIEIAASFNRVIQENLNLISKKIKYYDDGNRLIFLGLASFLLIWLTEKLLKMLL